MAAQMMMIVTMGAAAAGARGAGPAGAARGGGGRGGRGGAAARAAGGGGLPGPGGAAGPGGHGVRVSYYITFWYHIIILKCVKLSPGFCGNRQHWVQVLECGSKLKRFEIKETAAGNAKTKIRRIILQYDVSV
jgi:hypothetical protein